MEAKGRNLTKNAILTFYTAGDASQNQGDPCIGYKGHNICKMIKDGLVPLAPSRPAFKKFKLHQGDFLNINCPGYGSFNGYVVDKKGKEKKINGISFDKASFDSKKKLKKKGKKRRCTVKYLYNAGLELKKYKS